MAVWAGGSVVAVMESKAHPPCPPCFALSALSLPFRSRPLRHYQRGLILEDRFAGDHNLPHIVPAGKVEHDIGHGVFEDGAEAAGAGTALQGLLGHSAQRFGVE